MKEFYERLRKHKKETNKEFIEDFIDTLMSYGIENEKQLKELTIRTLKTKDGVSLTKEERMKCIHDRIEYCISRVINESIDIHDKEVLREKERNLKLSKTYEEKLINTIDLLYFIKMDLYFFEEIYQLIIEDKLDNLRECIEY